MRASVHQLKALPVASKPICKYLYLYLFFPRGIHDSLRIGVETFPQQIRKSSLEFCPLQGRSGNDDVGGG